MGEKQTTDTKSHISFSRISKNFAFLLTLEFGNFEKHIELKIWAWHENFLQKKNKS